MKPGRGFGLFLSPKTAILDLGGLGPLISGSIVFTESVGEMGGRAGLLGDLRWEGDAVFSWAFGQERGNIF